MTGKRQHGSDDLPLADGWSGVDLVEYIASDAITSERAVDSLCDLAASDHDAVGEMLGALATFATSESPVKHRQSAVTVVAEFVTQCPAYASEAVVAFGEIVDNPAVGTVALRALARVADENPEAIDPVLESVGRRLTDEPLPTRQSAVRIVRRCADADPTVVSQLCSQLVDAIATTDRMDVSDTLISDYERRRLEEQTIAEQRLRQQCAAVLEAVAAEDPDAVAPELDRLSEIIDPETPVNPYLKEKVVEIVGSVATASPESAVGTIDSLVEAVASRDEPSSMRALAARTLSTLAETHFEATTDSARTAIPALADLLTDPAPAVRANAGGLLSYVAQRHPDEVESLTEMLVARLDDEQTSVRAIAVWTLYYLDTERARDALRETADDDTDPDVRALAAELLSSATT